MPRMKLPSCTSTPCHTRLARPRSRGRCRRIHPMSLSLSLRKKNTSSGISTIYTTRVMTPTTDDRVWRSILSVTYPASRRIWSRIFSISTSLKMVGYFSGRDRIRAWDALSMSGTSWSSWVACLVSTGSSQNSRASSTRKNTRNTMPTASIRGVPTRYSGRINPSSRYAMIRLAITGTRCLPASSTVASPTPRNTARITTWGSEKYRRTQSLITPMTITLNDSKSSVKYTLFSFLFPSFFLHRESGSRKRPKNLYIPADH